VPISSKELGETLGISQQSASMRILELLKAGAITRELGARKQMVKLTRTGIDLLRREYSHYQRIFSLGNRLAIRGTIVTGLGEGKYYVNHKEYATQFVKKLGFRPYEGTLNVKVSAGELEKLNNLQSMDGAMVRGFKKGGRSFGDVKCFISEIKNLECAVIIPTRTHYDDIMEVISRFNLRRTLGLKDGDYIEISVNI